MSLGSVDTAKADLGASSLALQKGSFSAKALNLGAGSLSLQNGATLALQGENAGLLFSSSSDSDGATLSGGNLTALQEQTGFSLNEIAMSGNAKLDVLRGTATVDNAKLYNITVGAAAALQAQDTAAKVSGNNTLHLSAQPLPAVALTLADSPAPAAEPLTLVSDQLNGVSFTAGSTLTLHLDDVYSQLTAKTQEVTLILNNTAWEDADNMMTTITFADPARAELTGAVMQGGSSVLYLTVSIPEPATATLSLLALTALAARRRRKG